MNRNRKPVSPHEQQDDHRVGTIALVNLPHPTIPNLYQRCFEYSESWQWSPETERVGTGEWFFVAGPRLLPEPSASNLPAVVKPKPGA
jgi:hypothetical protein